MKNTSFSSHAKKNDTIVWKYVLTFPIFFERDIGSGISNSKYNFFNFPT
jgi:hypothetical protein